MTQPGDKFIAKNGEEFVAVTVTVDISMVCGACAFDRGEGANNCLTAPCGSYRPEGFIVFMKPIDAVTYKLTGETP